MSNSGYRFRCRFRLRTLLVAAPLAAWLIAWGLRKPVTQSDAWIIIHERPFVAAAERNAQRLQRPLAREQVHHAAALRSLALLSKSLDPPEIAALPIVQQQRDPPAWLRDQLRVEVQEDSNLIRISLKGHESDELAKIVGSVAATYSRTLRSPRR